MLAYRVLIGLNIAVAVADIIGAKALLHRMAQPWTPGKYVAREAHYTIKELPTSGNVIYHGGTIDDAGRIAYSVDNRSFVRSGDRVVPLEAKANWTVTRVLGADGHGNCVGYAVSETGLSEAILWRSGKSSLLAGLPGYPAAVADDVNESGQVAGSVRGRETDSSAWWSVPAHAVLWENGIARDLGVPPGCTISRATSVNNAGAVVGWAITKSERMHGCAWSASRAVRDLGTLPGGKVSKAIAINNRGQIIGDADDAAGKLHAVLWQGDQMVDLGYPPDSGGWCIPKAINDQGVVVGDTMRAFRTDGSLFVWDRRHGMRMISLPDGCRFQPQRAIDVAPNGRIVAAGIASGSGEPFDHRLFLLTPVTGGGQ